MDNGCIVPNGEIVKNDKLTQSQYNMFIVYDKSQIKMQYLVQFNFDHSVMYLYVLYGCLKSWPLVFVISPSTATGSG